MNDDLAQEIESMIDDDSAWGDPVLGESDSTEKHTTGQRSVVFSLRLNPDELAHLQACAEAVGSSVSAYVRSLIFGDKGSSVIESIKSAEKESFSASVNFGYPVELVSSSMNEVVSFNGF